MYNSVLQIREEPWLVNQLCESEVEAEEQRNLNAQHNVKPTGPKAGHMSGYDHSLTQKTLKKLCGHSWSAKLYFISEFVQIRLWVRVRVWLIKEKKCKSFCRSAVFLQSLSENTWRETHWKGNIKENTHRLHIHSHTKCMHRLIFTKLSHWLFCQLSWK